MKVKSLNILKILFIAILSSFYSIGLTQQDAQIIVEELGVGETTAGARIMNLTNQVSSLEAEVSLLKAQNDSLKAWQVDARKALENAKATADSSDSKENVALIQELEAAKARIADLETQIAVMQESIASASSIESNTTEDLESETDETNEAQEITVSEDLLEEAIVEEENQLDDSEEAVVEVAETSEVNEEETPTEADEISGATEDDELQTSELTLDESEGLLEEATEVGEIPESEAATAALEESNSLEVSEVVEGESHINSNGSEAIVALANEVGELEAVAEPLAINEASNISEDEEAQTELIVSEAENSTESENLEVYLEPQDEAANISDGNELEVAIDTTEESETVQSRIEDLTESSTAEDLAQVVDTMATIAAEAEDNDLENKIEQAQLLVQERYNDFINGNWEDKTVAIEALAQAQKGLANLLGLRTYVVQAGDSLSAVAFDQLNDYNSWGKILDANSHIINNPNIIFPGLELIIPNVLE